MLRGHPRRDGTARRRYVFRCHPCASPDCSPAESPRRPRPTIACVHRSGRATPLPPSRRKMAVHPRARPRNGTGPSRRVRAGRRCGPVRAGRGSDRGGPRGWIRDARRPPAGEPFSEAVFDGVEMAPYGVDVPTVDLREAFEDSPFAAVDILSGSADGFDEFVPEFPARDIEVVSARVRGGARAHAQGCDPGVVWFHSGVFERLGDAVQIGGRFCHWWSLPVFGVSDKLLRGVHWRFGAAQHQPGTDREGKSIRRLEPATLSGDARPFRVSTGIRRWTMNALQVKLRRMAL